VLTGRWALAQYFTIRSLTPSSRLKAVFHCGPAPGNVGAKSATFSRYTEVLLEHAEQGTPRGGATEARHAPLPSPCELENG
jgi:hypothetical protein